MIPSCLRNKSPNAEIIEDPKRSDSRNGFASADVFWPHDFEPHCFLSRNPFFPSILEEVPLKKRHLQYEGVATQMYRVTRVLAGRDCPLSLSTFTVAVTFSTSLRLPSVKAAWRREGLFERGSDSEVSPTKLRPASRKHTCMQTSTHTRAGEARMGYMGGGVNSLQRKTHTHSDWVEIKRTTMGNKKAGTGNGTSREIK